MAAALGPSSIVTHGSHAAELAYPDGSKATVAHGIVFGLWREPWVASRPRAMRSARLRIAGSAVSAEAG